MFKPALLILSLAALHATLSVAAERPMAFAAEPPMADPAMKPGAPTVPVITQDPKLFAEFGGHDGMVAIVDDAMDRWMHNPRTHPYFANADRDRIKMHLVEQFCVILGGPCSYTGRTMADAHRGMHVTEEAFYALAEDLQRALNDHHVPFNAQNRLIAALAPMHRDIVNK